MDAYMGWCVRLDYDYPATAGILFWIKTWPQDLMGVRTMVFRTRKQARTAAKGLYGKNRVVRVKVTIEEVS